MHFDDFGHMAARRGYLGISVSDELTRSAYETVPKYNMEVGPSLKHE